MLVKGRRNLEHCAYLGDSDSAGDSDELSKSNSAETNGAQFNPASSKNSPPLALRHPQTSAELLSDILHKIKEHVRAHPKQNGKLRKNLSQWLFKNYSKLINKAEPIANWGRKNTLLLDKWESVELENSNTPSSGHSNKQVDHGTIRHEPGQHDELNKSVDIVDNQRNEVKL